jgi:D-3-phosphoglycerate dehydrogenase
MKKTAYLINIARGQIVDETALLRASYENRIQGAALDVFEKEAIDPDNLLLQLDDVIVTPHRLARTIQGDINVWSEIVRHIPQLMKGEIPYGLVNREVLNKPEFKSKHA